MDEKDYKVVSYYGILITHSGDKYYLMADCPFDRLPWMSDHERMFLGAVEDGLIQQIIVSGYTLLPDRKGMIRIRKDKDTEEVELDEMQKVTHKLFQSVNVN